MRDLLIVLLFSFGIVKAFKEPIYGAVLWYWVAYMNPHRMTWGFAYGLPYAMITAIVAIPMALLAKKKINPFSVPTILLCLLLLWMGVTTIFAVQQDDAVREYSRFIKIVLMTLICGMLLVDKASIDKVIAVVVVSFGFFGVKGGLFTLATGGSYRVLGPADSFVAGNNEIALALLMVIPLMNYLRMQVSRLWLKRILLASMILMAVSAIGSQSRGALLATVAMSLWLWRKSNNKAVMAFGVSILAVAVLLFMPESWFERMKTIETYQQDGSAMGRINAWVVAWRIALDRLTAGGFNHWSEETFALYAPVPEDVHDVHSIYFEILGEHGFPAFVIYILIWILVMLDIRWITRTAAQFEVLRWADDLARMVQVSLIAYAVGGAFLGLAYFDLPWNLAMLVVATRKIVEQHSTSLKTVFSGASPPLQLDGLGTQKPAKAGFVRKKIST
jgi:putative inorganic carbon (HCO3(-)) transporter